MVMVIKQWEFSHSNCSNMICLLVVGLEHVLFSTIYGIILPIDELHHFARWLLHHQPDILFIRSGINH